MKEGTTELATIQPMTLLQADSPEQVIVQAKKIAKPLGELIREANLFTTIGPKDHVQVEGWLTLGAMMVPSVHPHTVWCRKLEDPDGWEARVEVRTLEGHLLSVAESSCARDESKWRSSDDYGIRSMAQTRATSKALGQALRFIMVLAGFAATPAEEMDGVRGSQQIEVPAWVQPIIEAGATEAAVIAATRKLIAEKGMNVVIKHIGHVAKMPDEMRVVLASRLGAIQAFSDDDGAAEAIAAAAQLGILENPPKAGEPVKAEQDAAAEASQEGPEGEDPTKDPEPPKATGKGHCDKHQRYVPTCSDCRWIRGEPEETKDPTTDEGEPKPDVPVNSAEADAVEAAEAAGEDPVQALQRAREAAHGGQAELEGSDA